MVATRKRRRRPRKAASITDNHMKHFLCRTITELNSNITNIQPYNLSSYNPTQKQLKLISYGSNFIPTPKWRHNLTPRHQIDDITDINKTIDKLNTDMIYKHKNKHKQKHKPILHKLKPANTTPPPNITTYTNKVRQDLQKHLQTLPQEKKIENMNDEIQALKTLCKTESVRVATADKNLGLILVDRLWYVNECLRQLNDKTTYQQISINRIGSIFNNFFKTVTAISKEKEEDLRGKNFNYAVINKMKEHEPIMVAGVWKVKALPLFKLLPKIHKLTSIEINNKDTTNLKGRPIIANFNSITAALSKWLDGELKPLLEKCRDIVIKDSTQFVNNVEALCILRGDEIHMAQIDFESLYTNIPIERGMEVLEDFLRMKRVPNHMIDIYIQCAKLVLKNNIFFCPETQLYYRQIQGTSMGTNFAPTYANIYLYKLEHTWVHKNSLLTPERILLFNRYIDDVCMIVRGSKQSIEEKTEEYKNTCGMNITCIVDNQTTTFLDVTVYRGSRERLEVKSYHKPTNKHLYITSNSFHPSHTLKGMITTILYTSIKNNSQFDDYLRDKHNFYFWLKARGYTEKQLQPLFENITYTIRDELLQRNNIRSSSNKISPLIVNVYYTPRTRILPLGKILHENWSLIEENEDTQHLQPPLIAYSRAQNVNELVNTYLKSRDDYMRPNTL